MIVPDLKKWEEEQSGGRQEPPTSTRDSEDVNKSSAEDAPKAWLDKYDDWPSREQWAREQWASLYREMYGAEAEGCGNVPVKPVQLCPYCQSTICDPWNHFSEEPAGVGGTSTNVGCNKRHRTEDAKHDAS